MTDRLIKYENNEFILTPIILEFKFHKALEWIQYEDFRVIQLQDIKCPRRI